MKNIIAIAGSNHKNSRTHRLLNMWLDRVSKLDANIHFEVYSLRNFKINMCEGCNSCFYNGQCALDKQDDMPFLREKMSESDVTIFSSPVYMHNLSGIMKNFIDRMAFNSHLLSLSGKLGFTLTTTMSSGGDIVSDMLEKVQTSMGIKNVSNFVFSAAYDNEITSTDEWALKAIEDISFQVGLSDQRLEEKFQFLKKHYSNMELNNLEFCSEIWFWQQPAIQ